MTLIVILNVRASELESFHEFESAAARIMADYGGRISRTVVISAPDESTDASAHKEVHVVDFPDRSAFESYRNDPRLAALVPLRQRSIISTDIWFGHDGPSYP